MAWVYILQSKVNGSFYIGSTSDLLRRMDQHVSKHTQTTTRNGPFDLVLSQEFPTLKEARAIEWRLKKLKRRDYIEKIIKDGKIKMQAQPRRSN